VGILDIEVDACHSLAAVRGGSGSDSTQGVGTVGVTAVEDTPEAAVFSPLHWGIRVGLLLTSVVIKLKE